MTKNFVIFILLFLCCKANAQQFLNKINFVQEDVQHSITNENSSLTLKKLPFSVMFENTFYNTKKELLNALKVAVIDNVNDLQNIEEGMPVHLIPYFENGTGFSADENGLYSSVIVNSYGHHYLLYENEDKKSIEFVSKKGTVGTFKWDVHRFYINEKDYPIERIPNQTLYFVFLTDFNNNNIIDTDELRIVKASFK